MLGKFIHHCEDSLTAAVFTHLLHLPAELFWQIMRNACYTDAMPEFPGEPLLVAWWPSWNAKGTRNLNRVVPDLFMRFPGLDLIIEAKLKEDGTQSRDQWKNELIAYANEYNDEGEQVEVRLIALGGLKGTRDENVTVEPQIRYSGSSSRGRRRAKIKCTVHMCRWRHLLAECQRKMRKLGGPGSPSSQTLAHQRILADVIELFGRRGFSTGQWFGDFNFACHHSGGDTASHHALFQQRSTQLARP